MSLLLVGCGKMGGAMLVGWRAAGRSDIRIVDPAVADPDAVADFAALPAGYRASTIVLAVKPQMMGDVVAAAAERLDPSGLVLSIAAGKTLSSFERSFATAAIVRAMPNLPASIARGISVCVANARTTAAQRAEATTLLSACGEVAWVDDEALIDPVTALSGGGPAYVFLLVEAMAAAGVKAGLPADLALRLARSTVAGSGALLDAVDTPAADLRRAVCSPGGTTLEAIAVLMADGGIQPLFDQAIAAASLRARELAE